MYAGENINRIQYFIALVDLLNTFEALSLFQEPYYISKYFERHEVIFL